MSAANDSPLNNPDVAGANDTTGLSVRIIGWGLISILAAFLINNYLILAHGWPGVGPFINGKPVTALSWVQLGFFAAGLAVAVFYVVKNAATTLRVDAQIITNFNTFIVRAAFWAVLFIGLADMAISFLRVEGLLAAVVGDELTTQLGRAKFRGPYVHVPLAFLGIVAAFFTRTLGFTWLALLIVIAELAIVITRFVFSYEQAFMGDLVRFWYAALFLFASAYTLLEEGHVRVDVFYAGFREPTKGWVNALGCLFLGLSMCWTILLIGLADKSAIINSPVMNFEVSQSGFGMYVKYLMAGFLGIFAITMAIQFVSYFLEAVADYRGEPGKRVPEAPIAH